MKDRLDNILFEVSKSPVIDNGELGSAYNLILNSLKEGLNVERTNVWLFNSDLTEIACQAHSQEYTTPSDKFIFKEKDHPNYFAVLKSNRVNPVSDVHSQEYLHDLIPNYSIPLNIGAFIDVPIRHQGALNGIISCEHIGTSREWSNEEVKFVTIMADLVGRAINAYQYKRTALELHRTNEELNKTIKNQTELLLESEKMAALGNLVAGVAHEINSPLGVGITASSALSDSLRDIQNKIKNNALTKTYFDNTMVKFEELLKILNINLERAADLVKTYKETSASGSNDNIQTLNMKETLSYLLLSLKPETERYNLKLNLDVKNDLAFNSYSSAWVQIVTNLILNSCFHAFDNTEKPEAWLSIFKEDDEILFTYADNGCGIANEKIKNVMEPFYTTRREQGGTGLGMSIVHNLVTEKLQGELKISNASDRGFNIEIRCPMTLALNNDSILELGKYRKAC